jgi:hypothetical protein
MAVAGQLKYGIGGGECKTYSPVAFVQGKFLPVHILAQGRSERFGEEVKLLFLKALGFPAAKLVTTQTTEHGVFTFIPHFCRFVLRGFPYLRSHPGDRNVSVGPSMDRNIKIVGQLAQTFEPPRMMFKGLK